MNKTVVASLCWVILSAGVIAGEWYGAEALSNIAMVIMWGLSIIIIGGALAGKIKRPKYANLRHRVIVRSFFFSMVIIVIGAGWFITSIVLLLSWSSAYIAVQD